MKKIYWICVIILALVITLISFSFWDSNKSKNAMVTVNNHIFNVEIADTSIEREKGLMYRKSIAENAGMLFVFPKSDIQTFWMRNTLIPLDIIWINDDKIVEISTLQPENDVITPQYTPENKANYVLELNAGIVEKYNIKVNDLVKITK